MGERIFLVMRFLSYIASLILHTGLILTVIFWPTKKFIHPERPIKISLTMDSVGGSIVPSVVLGQKISVPEKPVVVSQPSIEDIPLPSIESIPTYPEEVQVYPESIPQQEPQQAAQPLPLPKPEHKNSEKAIERVETKREPTKKINNSKSVVETPKKIPKNEGAKGNASLKEALADAKKKTQSQKSSSASSVSNALAGFKKQAAIIGGGGGSNEGLGGGGLHDVYAGLVMMAVRPNWSIPTYSRENLIALVHVRIDPKGNVISCVIERSSGRADFDASAVNAVIRTKILPVPPTPAQQAMIIVFNSLEAQ